MKSILLLFFISTSFMLNAQTTPIEKVKPFAHTFKMEKLFNNADPNFIQTSENNNDLLTVVTPKPTGKMPVLKIEAKPVIIADLGNGSYVYKLPIDNMRGVTGDIRSIPVMPGTNK
jgi:hypothetical protein